MTQTAVGDEPQTAFDEESIEDDQLEADLGEWLKLKEAKKEPVKAFKEKDAYVKARIESIAKAMEVPIGTTIRIGRFTAIRTASEEMEVSFTKGAKTGIRIRPPEKAKA